MQFLNDYTVQFASRPQPFLLRFRVCDNPDCDCHAIDIGFVELDDAGRPLRKGLMFFLGVGLEEWQEVQKVLWRSGPDSAERRRRFRHRTVPYLGKLPRARRLSRLMMAERRGWRRFR